MTVIDPASARIRQSTEPDRNGAAVVRPTPVRINRARLTPEDREFLPAALEILVTPPSPVARAMLLTICALFFGALVWSYFGWIDIYAVAPGKIQPIGRSKVVQPVELGKVAAIHVHNGSVVEAGDVLVELDPTELTAERAAQAGDLEAARAEAARRTAAIAAAQSGTFEPHIEFPPGISEAVQRRERGVLAADLGKLRSDIAAFKAQLEEKQATKQKLDLTIAAREKQIALAKEHVAMREQIDRMGAGSRALTMEALQQYDSLVTTDAGDRGQLIETEAAMESLARKSEQAVTEFVDDESQKLVAIEQKRDHLEEDVIKAQAKANHMVLRAPIAGTVQQLAISNVGQVVAAGESVLTVVPLAGPIEVEAMIANRDVGFVASGQPAVVKIDAFPFTRYGTIDGVVERISRDAVDERNATELSDAANAAKPQGGTPGSPAKTQDLVFPASIKLDQPWIRIDGKKVALSPGMGVTVEIKTGQRRAIDYLLSPLREMTSQAARER